MDAVAEFKKTLILTETYKTEFVGLPVKPCDLNVVGAYITLSHLWLHDFQSIVICNTPVNLYRDLRMNHKLE